MQVFWLHVCLCTICVPGAYVRPKKTDIAVSLGLEL